MATNAASFVTKTKVIIPHRRSNLLLRQQLLDRFQNLLDFKLINISAPAGYGKTSLLIDVAHQLELPVCWYAIDPLDNDPQRFITHFLAAILEKFPTLSESSKNIPADSSTSLKTLIPFVVNAVYEHIREHFIFILDDFHLITNKEIITFVDQFVQFADDNCHLVISSRELVTLPQLVLLAGRSEVGGLGIDDLSFHASEIRTLVSQSYNLSISQEAAEDLAHVTEGWITGLLLSAQTIVQNVSNRMHLAQTSGVDVYDYLAQQVFEQQPASVQDFLLRTSLLEEFNAELCQDIFGPANYPDGYTWSSLIHLIVQNNLFVLPLDNKGIWLRYHHLFQEFLQSKISQVSPQKTEKILQQLAKIHTEQGEWERAYALYQRLENTPATINLVERVGLQMVQAGRFKTLGTWIDTLPAHLLTEHPFLAALRGYVAAMLGDVKQGQNFLNQAEIAFRTRDNLSGLAYALVWRAGVYHLLGEYQLSLTDADEVLTLIHHDDGHSLLEAMAFRAKGQSLLATRRSGEAISSLQKSLDMYKILGEKENIARLYLELGVAYMTIGRYETALRHYDVALKHFQVTGNIIRMADLLNNKGVLHHLMGDYQKAVSALEQALVYAQQSNYVRMEAYVLCGIGDVYLDLEAVDAPENAYRQAHQIALQIDDSFLLLYLELVKATLARLREDFTRARGLLNNANRLVSQTSSAYEKGLYYLEAGQLSLAQQQYIQAVKELCLAGDHFCENGQRVEKARTQFHLAVAYHAQKEKQLAINNLTSAFNLISTLESRYVLVTAAQGAVSLLKAAQRWRGVGRDASHLLQQVQKFKQNISDTRRVLRSQPLAVPVGSPRLGVQTLGQINVTLNDKPIDVPEWKTQKSAREFFFYLLAHPEGQPREVIGNDLWPKSSPSELKIQFKNAIYRLRRALDKEFIIFDQDSDRYFFNPHVDYEYDVEIFERGIKRAATATPRQEKIDALTEAVNLYHGYYLPSIERTWVLPKKQRLQHLYIQANLDLARLNLDAEDYNSVLTFCWKGLQEDPSQEIAHRLAMQAYAAMGDRASVVRQFEQCEKALKEEVDAPVSSQTRELFKKLLT